jgi:hypothetical protein
MAKKQTEYVLSRDTRDYRSIGYEVEALGQRLDAARKAFDACKPDSWAQKHWQSVIDRLMFHWQQLPILHDAEATHTHKPRWVVRYDFYERDDGIGHNNFMDRLFISLGERLNGGPNLTESWERSRNARLAKAAI